MRYKININYRDWELISEKFEPKNWNKGIYDQKRKLGFLMEAWENNIPLYLNNDENFVADYIKELSKDIVTPEPIFSIFDKENLTFEEMLDAIQKRIPDIVKPTEGDDNPYESSHQEEEDFE